MILSENDPSFGKMQNIKRRFFALRNGVTADIYRRAGAPYRVIFGLDLVQIAEIGRICGVDMELAEDLWANDTTRESRLLAPMLVDRSLMGYDSAMKWIDSIKTVEEADVMCHRLLRYLECVHDIIDRMLDADTDMKRYVGVRLVANMQALNNDVSSYEARILSEKNRHATITYTLSSQVLDELAYSRS